MVIGLGIESTAHTFGIGITDENMELVANVKSMYLPEKGGIHPREAAQHHLKVATDILKRALKEAEIKLEDIDFIAFSQGPGLTLDVCLKGLV